MSASENSGTPKSSILIGFSIIFTIHFGVPLFLETPIYLGSISSPMIFFIAQAISLILPIPSLRFTNQNSVTDLPYASLVAGWTTQDMNQIHILFKQYKYDIIYIYMYIYIYAEPNWPLFW